MREMLNYIVEVNIALLLLLAFYKLVLSSENQFRLQRYFLLFAIMTSLIIPLVHVNPSQEIQLPSISRIVPEYWLPEVGVIDGGEVLQADHTTYTLWDISGVIYLAGVVVFTIWLIMQLGYVWIMLSNHTSYSLNQLKVIESPEDKPSFSFFNLIYIGKADQLTTLEKEQIIRHESEHARQLHSLDMLLLSILGIVFWFNPFIKKYKQIFIQLHEFEADARAVENSDVNKYCSLLARVALQAHFPIASHFNESLTVKRIEMMRTVKTKIKSWKIAASLLILLLCSIVIACQDQIAEEVSKSTISQTGDYPSEVREMMDKYLKEHPDAKLTYMDGDADEVSKFLESPEIKSKVVYEFDINAGGIEKKGVLLTNIVEYVETLRTADDVYVVVEQQAEYPGGYEALKSFIQQNLKYPAEAKANGTTGTVYVSMVITKTGALTDIKILKGLSPEIDAEALRVIRMLPDWKPGQQNGRNVNLKYNIPIRFDPKIAAKDEFYLEIQPLTDKLKCVEVTTEVNAHGAVIRGKVIDEEGAGLPGVNVIVAGTTTGSTTDSNGNFKVESDKKSGKIVASFIGYDSEETAF
jgi:TonB family protein